MASFQTWTAKHVLTLTPLVFWKHLQMFHPTRPSFQQYDHFWHCTVPLNFWLDTSISISSTGRHWWLLMTHWGRRQTQSHWPDGGASSLSAFHPNVTHKLVRVQSVYNGHFWGPWGGRPSMQPLSITLQVAFRILTDFNHIPFPMQLKYAAVISELVGCIISIRKLRDGGHLFPHWTNFQWNTEQLFQPNSPIVARMSGDGSPMLFRHSRLMKSATAGGKFW